MRLTTEQIAIIKRSVEELFGSRVEVKLFGSRLDDQVRGGDIDLLVQSPEVVKDRLEKMLALSARLQLRLGDQPIDILVVDPQTPLNPVHRHALQTGERL